MTERQENVFVSENTPTFRVPEINLADLILSREVQIRRKSRKRPDGVDPDAVEHYAKQMLSGAVFPDIRAVRSTHDPNKFIVYDGFTRANALKRAEALLENAKRYNEDHSWNGCTKLPTLGAIILEGRYSIAQLQYFAFKMNNTHGCALTFQERKDGFDAFIRSNAWKLPPPKMRLSLSEIGREFGLSHEAVRNRLKNEHEKLYNAYWKRENDSNNKWKDQHHNFMRTEGDKLVKNIVEEYQGFNERMLHNIELLESLTGQPKPEYRKLLADAAKKVLHACEGQPSKAEEMAEAAL
jgi:hypothetical protein